MVRILKPEIVVETGVSAGLSSAYILKALYDNHKGMLYSIDLPNRNFSDYLSKDEIINLTNRVGELKTLTPLPKNGPGFLIPEYLKKSWVLKIGESKQLLPQLLKEVKKVDIFLHDSEHSYKNMMFEFSTVWNYITDKGLLLSHDTNWNDSFKDFSRKVNCKPINLTFSGLKAIKK